MLPKETHVRLAKLAKASTPRTTAPKLADAILKAELDRIDVKHAEIIE